MSLVLFCSLWVVCCQQRYGGVNGTFSKRAYATGCVTRSPATRASAPAAGHCWPIPPQETLKHSSGSASVGSLGPGAHKVLFESPSVSGRYGVLILNVLSPFLPFYWGFSFALGRGVSFFGEIQHSPVDSCSAASCNFGVLAGEKMSAHPSTPPSCHVARTHWS